MVSRQELEELKKDPNFIKVDRDKDGKIDQLRSKPKQFVDEKSGKRKRLGSFSERVIDINDETGFATRDTRFKTFRKVSKKRFKDNEVFARQIEEFDNQGRLIRRQRFDDVQRGKSKKSIELERDERFDPNKGLATETQFDTRQTQPKERERKAASLAARKIQKGQRVSPALEKAGGKTLKGIKAEIKKDELRQQAFTQSARTLQKRIESGELILTTDAKEVEIRPTNKGPAGRFIRKASEDKIVPTTRQEFAQSLISRQRKGKKIKVQGDKFIVAPESATIRTEFAPKVTRREVILSDVPQRKLDLRIEDVVSESTSTGSFGEVRPIKPGRSVIDERIRGAEETGKFFRQQQRLGKVDSKTRAANVAATFEKGSLVGLQSIPKTFDPVADFATGFIKVTPSRRGRKEPDFSINQGTQVPELTKVTSADSTDRDFKVEFGPSAKALGRGFESFAQKGKGVGIPRFVSRLTESGRSTTRKTIQVVREDPVAVIGSGTASAAIFSLGGQAIGGVKAATTPVQVTSTSNLRITTKNVKSGSVDQLEGALKTKAGSREFDVLVQGKTISKDVSGKPGTQATFGKVNFKIDDKTFGQVQSSGVKVSEFGKGGTIDTFAGSKFTTTVAVGKNRLFNVEGKGLQFKLADKPAKTFRSEGLTASTTRELAQVQQGDVSLRTIGVISGTKKLKPGQTIASVADDPLTSGSAGLIKQTTGTSKGQFESFGKIKSVSGNDLGRVRTNFDTAIRKGFKAGKAPGKGLGFTTGATGASSKQSSLLLRATTRGSTAQPLSLAVEGAKAATKVKVSRILQSKGAKIGAGAGLLTGQRKKARSKTTTSTIRSTRQLDNIVAGPISGIISTPKNRQRTPTKSKDTTISIIGPSSRLIGLPSTRERTRSRTSPSLDQIRITPPSQRQRVITTPRITTPNLPNLTPPPTPPPSRTAGVTLLGDDLLQSKRKKKGRKSFTRDFKLTSTLEGSLFKGAKTKLKGPLTGLELRRF